MTHVAPRQVPIIPRYTDVGGYPVAPIRVQGHDIGYLCPSCTTDIIKAARELVEGAREEYEHDRDEGLLEEGETLSDYESRALDGEPFIGGVEVLYEGEHYCCECSERLEVAYSEG